MDNEPSIQTKAALWGGATALAVDLLGYLGDRLLGLPRLSFKLFDAVGRVLPGAFITWMIDKIIKIISLLNLGPTSRVAKLAEQTLAVAQFIGVGLVLGIALTFFERKKPTRLPSYGAAIGLIMAAMWTGLAITLRLPQAVSWLGFLWIAFIFSFWGWVLGKLIAFELPTQAEATGDLSRRQFLWLVGVGSFSILASAAGLKLLTQNENSLQSPGSQPVQEPLVAGTSGPAKSPPQAALEARFPPVPGVRPELTSNADFYRIDINSTPPRLDEASWRLELSGKVAHPLNLSLEELRARPAVSQAITLECISNEVGGDLISSSLWTGVPLKILLDEAGVLEDVTHITIESADGFYESIPIQEARDDRTLLVYEMNRQPLPEKHGYPLRIYIPNHYGMKQPKWIIRMEATDTWQAGYWVERGWSETAFVKTTSVIDAGAKQAADPTDRKILLGGIAYAGGRGISKVEVQEDDGAWQVAELRSPALSPLTWVQWRHFWQSQPGRHIFRVRAYDGYGQLQETQYSPPHPNGATGIHSFTS